MLYMLYIYHGWFQHITDGMEEFLERLNQRVVVGLVGGSDLKKINEQMSGKGNVNLCYRNKYDLPVCWIFINI